ncbi:MAG TPA: hypothetical protein VFD70_19295, partial [Anaerolineae bacterium]|nr:hypothetical protein [Anaerolineae bacterium]
VFLALAIVLYAVVDFFLRRYHITRQHLQYGLISFAIATLILLPLLLPFFQLERQYNFSQGRDPSLFSARPASYLATPASQWLYGNLTRAFYVASKGQPLFPGIVALGLALIGVIVLVYQKNRAWIFPVLLALTAFVLSFGPLLTLGRATESVLPFHLPYYFLAFVLTPLKSLNAPARFAVLVMLALALLAAYGTYALLRRSPRWGFALAAMCAALLLAEYIPVPLRLAPVSTGAQVSPAYLFLAQQPRAPVVEMPMGKPEFADQDKHVVYTYNSLYHLQPLVNGYSTFIPPDYYALVQDVQNFPSAAAVSRLKAWGAEWIVVHSDEYKNPNRLRARLNALPEIEHVQDFNEIWLYRIRH